MDGRRQWYLPDPHGNEAIGPLSHEDVVARLNSKQLRMDSFIWGTHFSESKWKRISELAEFSTIMERYPRSPLPKRHARGVHERPKQVTLEFAGDGQYGLQNIYRRFPRAPFAAEVIVHNQKRYCRGIATDISEKGVFIQISDLEAFEKGEEIVVTVRSNSEIGSFSAPGVVLRVSTKAGSEGYGIYFLRVNPGVRRQIAKYILNKLGGAAVEPAPQREREAA